MRSIEIENPRDRLSLTERNALDKAFVHRHTPDGGDEFILRPNASARVVKVAVAAIKKLQPTLPLPVPPSTPHWRVWQLRQAGWKYEALAAPDSPARRFLRGSSPESRKQLALRAVRNVEAFRRRAPAWWFDVMQPPPVTD
jgi:hypothetical protein